MLAEVMRLAFGGSLTSLWWRTAWSLGQLMARYEKATSRLRRAIHTLRNYIEDPEAWFNSSLKHRWDVLRCAMAFYDKRCSDGG